MKILSIIKCLIITLLVILGVFFASCAQRNVVSLEQIQRLDMYVNSDNEYIAGMFFDENILNSGVQPALMQKELDILDALADGIDPEVRRAFDEKYTKWLYCWAHLDSLLIQVDCVRQLLKCDGMEFQDLIEFCRQQNDDIFLLLYQLAARASCPYDQKLLQPAYELFENFPEFSKYWREVDLALQKEKPNAKNRTCNEFTIWYTRKMLETRYGYTFQTFFTRFG